MLVCLTLKPIPDNLALCPRQLHTSNSTLSSPKISPFLASGTRLWRPCVRIRSSLFVVKRVRARPRSYPKSLWQWGVANCNYPAGQGKLIGHTQPRRIAASSVAKRIAEELKTPLGEVVGYKVRFQDRLSRDASVKLMTDGILLAETQTDPLLKAYDTIIIDEAHERSLNIDFLLGYLRQILPRRPDLKIIVTSATIDADRFANHFASRHGPAPVIMVSGRMFPVEQRYRPYEESRDYGLNNAIADAVDELWSRNAAIKVATSWYFYRANVKSAKLLTICAATSAINPSCEVLKCCRSLRG